MNKKAMELPLSTIVTVVIVLLVLVTVGTMFFQQFSTSGKGFSSAQCVQLCQSLRAEFSSNKDLTWDKMTFSETRQAFCNGKCYETIECKARTDPVLQPTENDWIVINNLKNAVASCSS